MAKKRKHHRTTRRRRVGAASGMTGLLMKAAGVAGGVFAGGLVAKTVSSLDPKISGGVLLAGGLYLSGKSSSPLMQGLGYGLAAKGANNLLTSFGVIAGIGSIPMIGYRATPKMQSSVGNVMKNPIGGVKDLTTIGALYDN
jgi:hypothetical protein